MKAYQPFLALAWAGSLLAGCEEEFEQSSVAFLPPAARTLQEGSTSKATYNLIFSRPLDANGSVVIGVESETAVRGVHYDIDAPSFKPGEFRVTVPAGETTATVSLTALDDDAFTNGHSLRLFVKEVGGGVRSVAQGEATLRITDNDPPTRRLYFDFENCGERFSIPPGFTEERIPGFKADRGWGCQAFGYEGQGVQASAFGGESGTANTWLIASLASVDFASMSSAYIGFWTESFFGGAGTIELRYSTDYPGTGNPEDYTWGTIPIADQLPEAGSGQANPPDGFWKEVFVEAPELAGKSNVYIAFRYFGASNSSSASWTIDNLGVYGD